MGIERNAIIAHGAELIWQSHPDWVSVFDDSYFSFAHINDAINVPTYTPVISAHFVENRLISNNKIDGMYFTIGPLWFVCRTLLHLKNLLVGCKNTIQSFCSARHPSMGNPSGRNPNRLERLTTHPERPT